MFREERQIIKGNIDLKRNNTDGHNGIIAANHYIKVMKLNCRIKYIETKVCDFT